MENKKLIKTSSIITAVMLFLQVGTILINNLLSSVPTSFKLFDYLPLQIALVATAVLSLIARKKDPFANKSSKFSVIMDIATVVLTASWEVVRLVLGIIQAILVYEIYRTGYGAIMLVNKLTAMADACFVFCIFILLVITFIKSKNFALTLKTDFSKISAVLIVSIPCVFSFIHSAANIMYEITNGSDIVDYVMELSVKLPDACTTVVTLALAVVALLLGLISKKEKENA